MGYAVVVGNVYEGIQVAGPYEDMGEASKWANSQYIPEDFIATVMELVPEDQYSVPD